MHNIESLAWILGCKIGKLSTSYLGMPLGENFKSKLVWTLVIERIVLRLDSWKMSLLSKGERLTLLKSTLSSIPNYFPSLFTIPALVANRIEVKFRNFLWNDYDEKQRYQLLIGILFVGQLIVVGLV